MAASTLRAICLTAPTACGKTDLALELAEKLPLEIVSVDSAMVYRGMDIGTAKPDADVRAAVPHHLIDVADPAEAYSAGRFLEDATAAIADITSRGRLPLLVGGTLLYLRALTKGLGKMPQADAELRRTLDQRAADEGWPALHAELKNVDPEAAARIAPTDRQRIQRALEVYMLTGNPISVLHRDVPNGPRFSIAILALVPPDRSALARRIERRFDVMVEAGFIGEVEELRSRPDLTADTPSMRAVGYRQVWGYLDNHYDWDVARQRTIVATRQLAKRQMTWLRSERTSQTFEAFSPQLAGKLHERIRSEWLRWT
ncbi:MAG: tRNA (adenosine(37)-N6)-dimethylallyltransferase MiaA [Gammaproteobacteria bacterium]|nr:tRNA (adenosine(37)-N6)-dimethylallyltransferase MiaA [Gammaproteobacteria bacterium]